VELYYEGEAELSHVDVDEMAQCLGFTPRGQEGEYRVYAASGPFGAGEVKLYLRVLSQSPLVLEGRLEGLGTVNNFELSVAVQGEADGPLELPWKGVLRQSRQVLCGKGLGVRKEYKQGGGLGRVRPLRLGGRLRGLCRGYKGG